ncbi:MAG: hypothetical protein ACTSQP_22680 [Promethearchaeota archaeon]
MSLKSKNEEFQVNKVVKIIYIIGLFCEIISLFLDWYSIEIRNNSSQLVLKVNYSMFFNWIKSNESISNNFITLPNIEAFSQLIILIFLIILFLSFLLFLILNIGKKNRTLKLQNYSLGLIIIPTFTIIILIYFPIFYLIPHELYFPFIVKQDLELNLIMFYSIGPGYILQAFSFIFMFPYSMLIIRIVEIFSGGGKVIDEKIEKFLNENQNRLDIDALIAEEEFQIEKNRFLKNSSLKKFSSIKSN